MEEIRILVELHPLATIGVPNGIIGTRHFLLHINCSSILTMSVCTLAVRWELTTDMKATLSVQDIFQSFI